MNILIEGISEEEYRKVQEEDFERKLKEEVAAAEARAEARGELKTIASLVSDGIIPIETAAEKVGMPVTELREKIAELTCGNH